MITSRNSSEMSQLNEISYFFLGKKFLPFTDFFQKHFASSHEVSQLLTTRVARPLKSIRRVTYQQNFSYVHVSCRKSSKLLTI